MVRVQIVVAGGAVGQAIVCEVSLPDWIRAPQPLLRCLGVEAVGLDEGSLAVCLCQQAGVAVEEVGGRRAAGSASCGFADPSPKRVIPVARRLPVLAGLDQAFRCVVAVVPLPRS